MEYSVRETMYAVRRAEGYTGVYRSAEKACALGGTVETIEIGFLEGTPDNAEYVCFAQGMWSVLGRSGEGFKSDIYDAGPFWGVNIQSAAAGLFGYGAIKRGVEITVLRIYEVDRDYSDELPENLARCFGGVAALFENGDEVAETLLSKDYISIYFDGIKREEENAEKRKSLPMARVLDRIMSLACEAGVSPDEPRAEYLRERMRRLIACNYTMREIEILAVVMGADDNAVIAEAIENGAITGAETEELLKRLTKLLPERRTRICRRRKLKDYME